MKKMLLTLIAFATCFMVTNAATKYEINIAGIEVTSDNCNSINAYTSGNDGITSGYAKYYPESKTLYLYYLKISRDGSGEYAIHNRKCDDLKIVFYHNTNVNEVSHRLYSKKAPALKLERNTTIEFVGGANGNTVEIESAQANAIEFGSYTYTFQNNGTQVNVKASSGKDCFHGNGPTSTTVTFKGYTSSSGGNIKVYSSSGYGLNSFKAIFNDYADVTIQHNSTVQNVYNTVMEFTSSVNHKPYILEPYLAYYKDGSVYIYASPITGWDIYISSRYAAVLNDDFFPNSNFKNWLHNKFNKGYVSQNDVYNTTSMDVSSKSISSLQGIEYFTYLTSLDCSYNSLTSLNVNALTRLKNLNCSHNQITWMSMPTSLESINACYNNISGSFTMSSNCTALKTVILNNNPNLTTVSITGTPMTSLDVSTCASLATVNCYDNYLSSLNIANCPSLKYLDAHDNILTSLTNLTNSIEEINIKHNYFESLSLIGLSNLKTLNCYGNSYLKTLDCHANALTSLNVDFCYDLETLICNNNKLTTLNLTFSNSPLKTLNCANNKLTSLIFAGPEHTTGLPYLLNLDCPNNNLSSLDLHTTTSLQYLDCSGNKLGSLSVDRCSALTELNCSLNQLEEYGAGVLVNSLRTIPAGSQGILKFIAPGYATYGYAEANVITDAQLRIARNKRWIPKKYVSGSWVEIPVSMLGDVNGDGFVTSADVTAIYDVMLGNDNQFASTADVNGDGYVTSADVTAVYDILLGD